ncbi:uncharacterized protein LOC115947854 [Geospiza fortis]|uniref:Uncharacterized protein LOC115947854 n=1 Tax=Geospiza fortis TaxID=48883 RepID=A0A8N5EL20_GEOFO|nr:uncharacterized protein LOC115947854 [Geospiza fortis]
MSDPNAALIEAINGASFTRIASVCFSPPPGRGISGDPDVISERRADERRWRNPGCSKKQAAQRSRKNSWPRLTGTQDFQYTDRTLWTFFFGAGGSGGSRRYSSTGGDSAHGGARNRNSGRSAAVQGLVRGGEGSPERGPAGRSGARDRGSGRHGGGGRMRDGGGSFTQGVSKRKVFSRVRKRGMNTGRAVARSQIGIGAARVSVTGRDGAWSGCRGCPGYRPCSDPVAAGTQPAPAASTRATTAASTQFQPPSKSQVGDFSRVQHMLCETHRAPQQSGPTEVTETAFTR